MSIESSSAGGRLSAINRGFSKQSGTYDDADGGNVILTDLRKQVYCHVEKFLAPSSNILELNAGTGIDAMHFAAQGHRVHATDLSDGMIHQLKKKILLHSVEGSVTCQQVSFEHLDQVAGRDFDYVFSNFGGLNCCEDLSRVTRHLPSLLRSGAFVTWVVMPPVCPWELLSIFKGNTRTAFRRFRKGGTLAHLEGEYFRTYYHSLKEIRSAFGESFHLVESEALAALSPPPHRADFPLKHPWLYRMMRKADACFASSFPFKRWGDHIVVTFRYGSAVQAGRNWAEVIAL